ncbi:hypothetical protein [Ralstonia pseudosolanacearum]|uniref:hypothetical protein n=1 Tax=Ralstonia pseudosolanacearum TaxID=1310165 RepID=UPI001FF94DAD|nr:hypothetical protein [Ralstonia pseudosolanacearum]
METRADHQQAATEARAFFSECATEQPAPSMVETLHPSKQDDYAVRHADKRGRDLLADKPISGNDSRIGAQKTSSQFSTRRNGARAPSADLPRRQALTHARGEYIARLHQHVVNMLGDAGGGAHLVRPSRAPYVADSKESVFAIETGESDVNAPKRRGSWNLPLKGGYTLVAEACASAATDVGIVLNGIPQTRSSDRICGIQMQKCPVWRQSEPG